MNSFYCLIILLLPLTFAYPSRHSNDLDRFLDTYLRERSGNVYKFNPKKSNEEFMFPRQNMFPLSSMQQYLPPNQPQPMCLPNIWTCGPGLPPCCPGLMCYDGNAKRGRHCLARG